MTIKEKKEKRAGLVVNMRALLNKASVDKRELNADETTSYNAMETDVDKLGGEIDRDDRLAVTENHLRNRKDHNYRPGLNDPENETGEPEKLRNSKEYKKAMFNARQSYCRVGKNGLSGEFVNVLTEGVDTAGGYLVPEEYETNLIENLVNADPIRAGATVITTRSDRNIPIETGAGTFSYVGENGVYPTSDPAIGRQVLSAFKSGGIILVSEELVQDAAFDLAGYISRLSIRRYNALEQPVFANGNGAGQPKGIFQTTAVSGTTVASNIGGISATAVITSDDLINTFHTLARAYRDNASWITSDAMIKLIRKLKESTGQYLWQPGLQAGQPDRLLNRPILVSDGAPVPAVGGTSICFGDWSYYYIADRLGMSIQRLSELYAASGQVGYKINKRNDGRMVFAPAMCYFQHGAGA